MCAYDEARKRGEKHSTAITEAVERVRGRYPISETTVKRIFATFRSRNGQTENILWFKGFTLSKKKLARLRSMLEQVPHIQGENGTSVPAPSTQNLTKSLTAYKFGYAKRPHYPRHNRKNPKV